MNFPLRSALRAVFRSLLAVLALGWALTAAADTASGTLTVRAYASLAAGVGAMMTVRVDGAEVGTVEVRDTLPQDYSFAAPTLKPGSQVDVAFTNDATINGADRNLYVVQLNATGTAVVPNATNSRIDRGMGAAAFDDADVLPGASGLAWNAALRLTWPVPNLTHVITVRASGTPAGGEAPRMVVRVDGTVVGTADVTATTPADHVFTAPAYTAGSKVDVAFTNAGTATDGTVRSLNLHYLIAGTTVLRPGDAGVKFDAGAGMAAYDGANVSASQVALVANGAVRGTWPAPNMSDTLTVRASGTLAAGVGPIAQILADGVLLGTYEIRSTTPVDISLPALPLKPGQRIEVRPTNLGTFNGATRSLNVAYAMSGTTVLQANAASLDAAWPSPNLTDTLNIRARGTLAGGVGPIMQVLVDGILVGSTEVRSTVFADYRFAVPPMSAGRKVDVVFNNDTILNGEDRNLFIGYVTSGNTVLLPNAAGNLIDLGRGAAALDGVDTLPGTGTLASNSALRATWPAPNITSNLTIRASATSAGGVGALMILWVDGVAVSSVEVKSTTPTDYLMPTTPIKPGSKVAIVFSNRGNVDGVERALNVHYAIAGTTFLAPTTPGASYTAGDLTASWPSPNITDTLTVRAYASLAGGTGALMAVRVDGVQVAQVQVDATEPTDYRIGVPALKPGSLVDLAFTNNALIDGADRNLYVLQLSHGATALVPGATNSSVDRGTGYQAFDGVDVIAGGTGLWSNGALRLAWPAPNLVDKITVRASGVPAGNEYPRMVVRVDGIVIGTVEVNSAEPADHTLAAPAFAAGSKVDVAFANADSVDGSTRTLNVHYLMAGTTVLRPTGTAMRFDAGSGLAAYDGAGLGNGMVALTTPGALRGTWPTANMSDRLTLRMSGTLAAGSGPLVQVLADGVLLGTLEVRATTPTDYSLAALPLVAGQRIEVRPTNLGTFNGATRSVNVAYAISGTTVLQASATGSSSLDAPWPAPNLTDTLNVRARADLAGGVGALMQIWVDGVMVGATEVRSTVFADYRFAVPPMSAGRKVDVVYANNAMVDGEDRNLHIAYLTNGSTVLLPTAAGNSFDGGVGSAAFDGLNLSAASGTLWGSGALRTTWPVANITDTLTIRASATSAGGVGALMILWVDGVAVSSVEVKSSTPTDYLMPTTLIKPGSKVAITFANRGSADGVERALNVHYAIAGTTFLAPTTPGASYTAGDLSASWPSPNITDTLTVRAYASLAGATGATMVVRVDGVQVAQLMVDATEPTDYRVGVPTLKPGSQVDVAFTNNALIDGADRNLYVVQLNATGTAVVPSATNSRIDRGNGAAAFDEADVLPGSGALYANGALRLAWPLPNLTHLITVRASGTPAGGEAPRMVVRVDGTVVGTADVTATTPADHVFTAPAYTAGSKVDVAFTNAGTAADGTVRSLNLHYLIAGTTVLRPGDAGVKFDAGSGMAAYDGANVSASQVALVANGAVRGTWPAPNMSDTLTVRASSTLAAGVGPIAQILADGVLLGTYEIRSTTPVDISLPALPLKPGQRIEVRPTNLGTFNGATRSLNVAYAMSGTTVLQATSAGAASLDAAWPSPNLTDTLNIRARGALAAGVGPIMQVLVDGILVGSTEVKSTVFADYRFAVPPMSAGRKVDVVFNNDTILNGEDRNLFIGYVTSGNTVLLPNAAGNLIDLGRGAAALDGVDTLPGTGTLASNSALRATWPAPNITSNLTIRASATSAGGVGALMILWVDGVAVSSVEVKSTTPTDYLMPTTPIKPGSKVAIVFSNRGNVDGVERALNVHYAIAGTTFLAPTTPGASYTAGDLAASWPSPNITDTLTVRAYASLAGGTGALMQLRVNGVIVGSREVTSGTPADYVFAVPTIRPGDKVDVVYTNDGIVGGVDRNLYVMYIRSGSWTLGAFSSSVVFDAGAGEAALDGQATSASSGAMYNNGALRFSVASTTGVASTAAQLAAARLLQQASFGATTADIARAAQLGRAGWIDEQLQLPFTPDTVAHVEAKFALGDSYRPIAANYTSNWVVQRFWAQAANSPHQLRRRTGFALHQILTISQADSNLYRHVRGYAQYVDTLNRLAFGNYRDLLEEVALSPMMGIYLSHMRNRPEDTGTGRMPDENFARELMQLFTIGLHELNIDGTPVLGSGGQPIETYGNADVMALARAFTGWSWGYPDNQLSENTFRWSTPDLSTAAADQRIDLQRMKPYPGQHSTVEKRLFAGKTWAVTLPAGNSAQADLKAALDVLFNHPNVGPFIGRQLIQRLVTSHPSPAYVARVAGVFNNNGLGVRGDLGAVVRAILMDTEAINPPAGSVGKLREPVLAATQWLRGLEARSNSGEYLMNYDIDATGQRPWSAPSVFGYFRPGYVPPNTALANSGTTVPELQIANESSTTRWANLAMMMAGNGLGWNNTAFDVTANIQPLMDLSSAGQVDAMVERLNLLLHAGRMSSTLKADITDAVASVGGADAASHANRARVALFLALASPEYLIQR